MNQVCFEGLAVIISSLGYQWERIKAKGFRN